MNIKFKCPHCQRALSVRPHLVGKRVPCPACKQILSIPAPVSRAADIEEFAAAALADQPQTNVPEQVPTTIEFTCPYCDEKVRVGTEFGGKQTPCPECRRIVKVPVAEKKEPKDWRKVDTRLTAGILRDVERAPEGTWDARVIGTVSQQALAEAQAIREVREPWTWQQWVKRGAAVASCLGLALFATWLVLSFTARSRESHAVSKTLQALDNLSKANPLVAAELYRALGEHSIRSGKAEEARAHFQKSRAAIVQAGDRDPVEREWLLIDLAQSQVELGGDREEATKGLRIKWDDAQKEIRQTLQNLRLPEGRIEAAHLVTRKLIEKGQGARAAPLASQFPEQASALLATIGLEMLDAGQDRKMVEALAGQAQQPFLKQPAKAQEQKTPARIPPSSLIALWLALGKPDMAKALADPPQGDIYSSPAVLAGYVEGWARQGDADRARKQARAPHVPLDRLQALVAIADAAIESGKPSAARPDLEAVLDLVQSELKTTPIPSWLLWKLVRLGVQAGLGERVETVARLIADPALRGRAQLEILRGRLAGLQGQADDSLAQVVGKDALAYGLAVEAIARHGARFVSDKQVQKMVDSWEPETARPFGYIGMALGMQDVGRK
jgi:hypothetical protein